GDPYATIAPAPPPPPTAAAPTLSRYRRLSPHARGRLTEVSVAHDQELHRDVALKEIQSRYADDPGLRARFLREAEITGHLEHPGVVPIYILGTYGDGRQYVPIR